MFTAQGSGSFCSFLCRAMENPVVNKNIPMACLSFWPSGSWVLTQLCLSRECVICLECAIGLGKLSCVVLMQGLCSLCLLEVVWALEIGRLENHGMLKLPKSFWHCEIEKTPFPFLCWKPEFRKGNWSPPFLPGNLLGKAPCPSLHCMSSAVPLTLIVISSFLLFQFVLPSVSLSLIFFFNFLLVPCFSSSTLSSFHSQTCSLLLPLLLCIFSQYLPFLIILPVYLLKFTLLIKPQRKSSLRGTL